MSQNRRVPAVDDIIKESRLPTLPGCFLVLPTPLCTAVFSEGYMDSCCRCPTRVKWRRTGPGAPCRVLSAV
ncbi:hypothetical protein VTK56DRAFT_7031 [Thermocarpiscus australiensis]